MDAEPQMGSGAHRVRCGQYSVRAWDDIVSHYVFDFGVDLRTPSQRRPVCLLAASLDIGDEAQVTLGFGVRAFPCGPDAIEIRAGFVPPEVRRDPEVTVIREIERHALLEGPTEALWKLLHRLHRPSSVAALLEGFDDRDTVLRLLAALAETDLIDLTGQPLARTVLAALRRGALPGPNLEAHAVEALMREGNQAPPETAVCLDVDGGIPRKLLPLHKLTRARRSPATFEDRTVARRAFDAILSTACGISGSLAATGTKLRAYPSAGALFAVEIYPLPFGVRDLEPAVYRYHPADQKLELIRRGLDRSSFVECAVAPQRPLIEHAAAFFLLYGNVDRFARKYGHWSYPVLAAEAGHISYGLILAATALGLGTRPVGAFSEPLLRGVTGLEDSRLQFLLAVAVGHSAPRTPGATVAL